MMPSTTKRATTILLGVLTLTAFAGLAQAGPVTIEDDGTIHTIVMTVTWQTQVAGDDETAITTSTSTSSPQGSGTGLDESAYQAVSGEDSEACGGYVAGRCVEVHAENNGWKCDEAADQEDAQSCGANFTGLAEGEQWVAPAEITARGYLGGTLVDEETCQSGGALQGQLGCQTPNITVPVDGVILPETDGETACSDVILFEGEGDDGQVSVGPVTLEGKACWTYHEDTAVKDFGPFDDDGGGDDGGGSDPGDPGPCRTCQ